MLTFQERLKDLRTEHGLTQKELAVLLNTTDDSIHSWEKGRSEPSLAMLIAICHTFKVSADYILGIEDEAGAKEYR